MAALENIRKRSVLLLSVIGFAMLAFILGDFRQSQRSGGSSTTTVGEVLGEKINIQDFQYKVEEGIENFKIQNPNSNVDQTTISQIRNQIWDQYIKDLIMDYEYLNLGINVTDEEFFELLQGVNVHPEISKVPAFQDPNTGLFDRSRIVGYLKNIDSDPSGEAKQRWVAFQSYLLNQIKESKYKDLISNSIYVTNIEALSRHNDKNFNVNFDCVKIPFSYLNDSLINIETQDIKKYYKQNINNYKQEESKDVDYVVFNVVYSTEDELQTKNSIESLIEDFKLVNEQDLEVFVRRNSDNLINNFSFQKNDSFIDKNFNELISGNTGIIGPYKNSENSFRIAKLVSSELRPDSVEAKHILIATNENVSIDSAKKIVSKLKLRIENGESFNQLAQQFSEDKGSAIKGGDLGWFKEGVMVKEFNDACFSKNFEKLSVVTTQFGVHLINVVKRSSLVNKYKIVYIDRTIEASSETINKYYSKAAEFANEILNNEANFDSLVTKFNLAKRSDSKVKKDKENISGLPNSREMVKWLFDSEKNQVSEVLQFDKSFVVAYVREHYKEGFVNIENVKNIIKPILINTKKSDEIISIFESFENLEQISTQSNIKVLTNNIANITNTSMPGIGFEPKLSGHIISNFESQSADNKVLFFSTKNAVYFYEIKSFAEAPELKDYSLEAKELSNELITYSSNSAYKSLKTKAKVIDDRSLFY